MNFSIIWVKNASLWFKTIFFHFVGKYENQFSYMNDHSYLIIRSQILKNGKNDKNKPKFILIHIFDIWLIKYFYFSHLLIIIIIKTSDTIKYYQSEHFNHNCGRSREIKNCPALHFLYPRFDLWTCRWIKFLVLVISFILGMIKCG